jgi:hypothetical protein
VGGKEEVRGRGVQYDNTYPDAYDDKLITLSSADCTHTHTRARANNRVPGTNEAPSSADVNAAAGSCVQRMTVETVDPTVSLLNAHSRQPSPAVLVGQAQMREPDDEQNMLLTSPPGAEMHALPSTASPTGRRGETQLASHRPDGVRYLP